MPDLNAYQNNQIAIDSMKLPADARIARTSMTVVPQAQSGVVAHFGVSRYRAASVILHDAAGRPLPAGAHVHHAESSADTIVGYDGNVHRRTEGGQPSRDRLRHAALRHDIRVHGARQQHAADPRPAHLPARAMKFALLLFVAFAMCAACRDAQAETCTATASTVSFGSVSPISRASVAATGTVSITCTWSAVTLTPNVLVCLSLGGTSARSLVNGTNAMQYDLYLDAGHSVA